MVAMRRRRPSAERVPQVMIWLFRRRRSITPWLVGDRRRSGGLLVIGLQRTSS